MNIEPRPWQSEFVRAFKAFLQVRHGERGNTYSAMVCPGAGKTIAAYLAADDLLRAGVIKHVIVVGHTSRIRAQWCETGALMGLGTTTDIPTTNKDWPYNTPVLVVTYQQVISRIDWFAGLCTQSTPTLVIFDEIHHCADDNSWGSSIQTAFKGARARLLLTGTAFRRTGEIAYIRYDSRTGRVRPDFTLDYEKALRWNYRKLGAKAPSFSCGECRTDRGNARPIAKVWDRDSPADVSKQY